MDFSDDTIETGFLYAIENLPDDWSTERAEEKVASLKENAELLEEALEDDDERAVMKYLRKILPIE